jgi:hypothetical protein
VVSTGGNKYESGVVRRWLVRLQHVVVIINSEVASSGSNKYNGGK